MISKKDKMEETRPLSGTTVSVARRRLKMLACLLLGSLVVSSVVTCGYFAYKKFQDSHSDSARRKCTITMLPSDRLVQTTEASPGSHGSVTGKSTIMTDSVFTTLSNAGPRRSETIHTSTDPQSQKKSTTPKFTSQTSPLNVSTTQTSTAYNVVSTSTRTTFILSPEQTSVNIISNEQTSTGGGNLSSSTKETITYIQQTITDFKTMKESTDLSTLISSQQTTITDDVTKSLPPRCSTALHLNFSGGVDSDLCMTVSYLCDNGSAKDDVPHYCECAADGMWTIIQRRFDGSVDFFCNWTDYKNGFGNLNGEFWLGNDVIHQITVGASYMLKIYLTGWDNVTKYAVYETFRITDETDNYRLSISGYSGDAGDALTLHNGQMFSTKDRDNDNFNGWFGSTNVNLAADFFSGAWWFGPTVNPSSLNGPYQFEPAIGDIGNRWEVSGDGLQYPIKETKMLIKPVN